MAKQKTRPVSAQPPTPTSPPCFNWALPKSLKVPADPLRLRLDFHHQAVVMHIFDGDVQATKIVSAMDISHALAKELTFSSGFLPPGTLWWMNTANGPVCAVYDEPRVRRLALQKLDKEPQRFTLPLPGMIFLCCPGLPPWVYAVKRKPYQMTDIIYKSPLLNVFDNGRSCAGSNKYPTDLKDTVDSFYQSYFTHTAGLSKRSVLFPDDILHLWEFIDKKKEFPLDDLVQHGTVADLMRMEVRE